MHFKCSVLLFVWLSKRGVCHFQLFMDQLHCFRSVASANKEEIAAGISGGIVLVMIIVLLIIYRNWRYEQELDSLLWKIDFRDIQIPELPTVSGLGKAPRVCDRRFIKESRLIGLATLSF